MFYVWDIKNLIFRSIFSVKPLSRDCLKYIAWWQVKEVWVGWKGFSLEWLETEEKCRRGSKDWWDSGDLTAPEWSFSAGVFIRICFLPVCFISLWVDPWSGLYGLKLQHQWQYEVSDLPKAVHFDLWPGKNLPYPVKH